MEKFMKKLSVLLLLAVAVCVAPAAYAQRLAGSGPKPIEKWSDPLKKKDDMQKFGNNIIRQVQKAKKAYEQQAKAKEQNKEFFKEAAEKISFSTLADHESQPREQDTDRNPYFKGGDPHNDANYEKCRTCGEPITDERLYRRCPQDPDIMCLPAPKAAQPAKPAKCRTCGEPVAEGSYRRCPQDPDVMCLPAPKDASKNYTCYRCGKSFRPGQHCSAADYNAFCAKDAEQEKALEKAEQQRREQAAKDSVCPKCGEEYSIDEIYHGVPHTCHK